MFPIDMHENEAHYYLKMKHIIQNQAKTNRSQSSLPTSISHVFCSSPYRKKRSKTAGVFVVVVFEHLDRFKIRQFQRWHLRRTHGLVGTCLGIHGPGSLVVSDFTLNFSGIFSDGLQPQTTMGTHASFIFRGYNPCIGGLKLYNLHFSWFWGSKVVMQSLKLP